MRFISTPMSSTALARSSGFTACTTVTSPGTFWSSSDRASLMASGNARTPITAHHRVSSPPPKQSFPPP